MLPPYSFSEYLNNFVVGYISPISGLWTFLAGVGAVVVPLIAKMYSRKRNENKTLNHYGS